MNANYLLHSFSKEASNLKKKPQITLTEKTDKHFLYHSSISAGPSCVQFPKVPSKRPLETDPISLITFP